MYNDRLNGINIGLNKSGVKSSIKGDSLIIEGCKSNPDGGCTIDSNMDHRIAMSFSILSLVTKEPITIKGCNAIKTSLPSFYDLLFNLGANIE